MRGKSAHFRFSFRSIARAVLRKVAQNLEIYPMVPLDQRGSLVSHPLPLPPLTPPIFDVFRLHDPRSRYTPVDTPGFLFLPGLVQLCSHLS